MEKTNLVCDTEWFTTFRHNIYLLHWSCTPFLHLLASEDAVAWNNAKYNLWCLGNGSPSPADTSMVINSHSSRL